LISMGISFLITVAAVTGTARSRPSFAPLASWDELAHAEIRTGNTPRKKMAMAANDLFMMLTFPMKAVEK